jgi:hypothetical protein
MPTDAPVMDTLSVMTAASVDNSDLSARELMIARLAALVATDASPASYVLNVGPAVESGLTLDDAQAVLVAVAPLVGTARVVTAAMNLSKGLGFVIGVADEEIDLSE